MSMAGQGARQDDADALNETGAGTVADGEPRPAPAVLLPQAAAVDCFASLVDHQCMSHLDSLKMNDILDS